MKLVNYRCTTCEEDLEEIFNDLEEQPEYLDYKCPECGGDLLKFNFKDNNHRVYINDSSGVV